MKKIIFGKKFGWLMFCYSISITIICAIQKDWIFFSFALMVTLFYPFALFPSLLSRLSLSWKILTRRDFITVFFKDKDEISATVKTNTKNVSLTVIALKHYLQFEQKQEDTLSEAKDILNEKT